MRDEIAWIFFDGLYRMRRARVLCRLAERREHGDPFAYLIDLGGEA